MRLPELLVCLLENHKLVRRLLVLWACVLISIVTWWVFRDLTQVTPAVAAIYGTAAGLLSVVLGLYQVTRSRDAPYEMSQQYGPIEWSPGKSPGEGEPG